MLIKPTDADFVHWLKCVPTTGDLLLFDRAVQHIDLPLPILSAEQIRAQAIELWKLNDRSWYGYSLNNAAYGAWFPSGLIEKLDEDFRAKLASTQIRLRVPTLIRDELLPRSLKRKLPCFGAITGIISPNWQNRIIDQWIHWAPLEELLTRRGFSRVQSNSPYRGDVLVFLRKNTPVHAAYALDDETYFEKPGQDFYEPYRLVRFKNWKQEWSNSKIAIYRRNGTT